MSKLGRIVLASAFLTGIFGVSHAAPNGEVAVLKQQVADLQAKIADLEKKLADAPAPGTDPAIMDDPWDPFLEMRAMQQQMDALMGSSFGGYGPSRRGGMRAAPLQAAFSPDYDIKETDKGYVISFDMPGMDKSRINVEVKEGVLLISGERSSESKESRGNKVYHQERSFGYFSRLIPLPKNAKADSVQAQYDNGVLTVTVEKKDPVKPKAEEKRKIQVK